MTPRERATQLATAVFQQSTGPASIWDPLVNALERAELLELAVIKAEELRAEEKAHNAALLKATKALRREGVNPVTWSALIRALSACSGQKELPGTTAAS